MHLKHRVGSVIVALALAGMGVVAAPAQVDAATGQVSDIANFTGFLYQAPATATKPASVSLISNTCLLVSDGENDFFKCTVTGKGTPSATGGLMIVRIKSNDGLIVFRDQYDNATGTGSGILSETDADALNCTTFGTGVMTFSTTPTIFPHVLRYKGSITVTDNPPVGHCDPDDIPHGPVGLRSTTVIPG